MEPLKTPSPQQYAGDTNTRFEELEANVRQIERRLRADNRRLRFQSCIAWCALVGSLFLSHSNREAIAAGETITLSNLAARVTVLESQTANLKAAFANLRLQPGPQGPAGPQGARGPQGPAGTSVDTSRIATLESKTRFISADATAKTTTFTGCNVLVQNGLGATNGNPGNPAGEVKVNGLGNLIVGYNGFRGGPSDVRTGSHNLVLGDQNSYRSYGGFVAGAANLISGPYATVAGGAFNTALGNVASVTGGRNNTALGGFSSVTGGQFNEANGLYSSVSGGSENVADSISASVSGGTQNSAQSLGSSVSGGFSITEQDEFGWAAGSFHSP